MNASDIETALRARAAFNASVDSVDADTRRRLRAIRLHAQHDEPRRAKARWAWPAGAALTAALALAVFLPRLPHAPAATTPIATVAITHPVTAFAATHPARAQIATTNQVAASDPIEAADPDMLSDLDFYGWLAKQPNTHATGG